MSAEDVALIEDGRWRGLRDGKVELTAHWAGATAGAVVEVRNAAADSPTSFRNDVIPVLTRAGCNAGACHGSAAGKNGFHLSLFGYDPAADHRSLTREFHGRRVDVGDPDQSLMLAKPTRLPIAKCHEDFRRQHPSPVHVLSPIREFFLVHTSRRVHR